MAMGPCVECRARPARYTYQVGRAGICRICLYNLTGESPEDRAAADAASEEEYQTLAARYRAELLGAATAQDTVAQQLLRYYADKGYGWAQAAARPAPATGGAGR